MHLGFQARDIMTRRAIMALPKWQRNGGRDFAFYHAHSGFEWEDLETTNKYQEMLCHDFQVGPVHTFLARIRLCGSGAQR